MKLKNCPFCGGEAGEFSLGVSKHSYIKCRICGAGAPTKPTAAEAVAVWNRRHDIEAIHEVLDLADVLRGRCKNGDELAISNGLSLGKIAIIVGHEYKG